MPLSEANSGCEHFVADHAALLEAFKTYQRKKRGLYGLGLPSDTPNCLRWKKGSGLNGFRCSAG